MSGGWLETDYVQEFEGWGTTQFETYTRGDPDTPLTIVALVSLAFGVRSPKELMAATGGAFAEYYFAEASGLDGMVAALAGIQLHKKRYATMAFPALLETYKLLKDIKKGNYVDKKSITRSAIFLAGFMASKMRFV